MKYINLLLFVLLFSACSKNDEPAEPEYFENVNFDTWFVDFDKIVGEGQLKEINYYYGEGYLARGETYLNYPLEFKENGRLVDPIDSVNYWFWYIEHDFLYLSPSKNDCNELASTENLDCWIILKFIKEKDGIYEFEDLTKTNQYPLTYRKYWFD